LGPASTLASPFGTGQDRRGWVRSAILK
jgi:hypothetical protein